MAEVDVFHGSLLPQSGFLHPGGDLPVLAQQHFAIDEQAKALLEGQFAVFASLALLLQRLKHAGELEAGQLIEGGMLKHCASPVLCVRPCRRCSSRLHGCCRERGEARLCARWAAALGPVRF